MNSAATTPTTAASPVPNGAIAGRNLLQQLDYSVLQQCIHCGMCLPTCPTYDETRRERNSPRGRIALMRAVADGEIALSPTFAEEMNYCLGCLACTTACPAGVNYSELFETARAASECAGLSDTSTRRFWRRVTLRELFRKPRLFHAAATLLGLFQRSGAQTFVRTTGLTALLPENLKRLEPSAPKISRAFSDAIIAARETPRGIPRLRVGLLTGCVQDIVFAHINRATADVLLANDIEVITPRLQGCCGSLHAHNGDLDSSRELARKLIDAFEDSGVDFIISNAAGCGAHLKHFDRLLAQDPEYTVRAQKWSARLRDISEFLSEVGFRIPKASPFDKPTVVTYHDACHLCHGQGVVRQPREILRALPGVDFRESIESAWCCGSAGVYSITHPETAARLRTRKWKHLHDTDADVVAMGNPGCTLHLQASSDSEGTQIAHPVELLAWAYAKETQNPGT